MSKGVLLVGLLLAALAAIVAVQESARAPDRWQAVWINKPQLLSDAARIMPNVPPPLKIHDQTIRQIIPIAPRGLLRITLANPSAQSLVRIDEVRVASLSPDGHAMERLSVPVIFGGSRSITLQPGSTVVSAPFLLDDNEATSLAISLYIGDEARVETMNISCRRTNQIAPGNQTIDPLLTGAAPIDRYAWLERVEAYLPQHPTVVLFGDSITYGVGATPDTNNSYADHLTGLLTEQGRHWSVVEAGLPGNRLLHQTFGEAGLNRFAGDVLHTPGVSDTIIQLGINDIGLDKWLPEEVVSAEDVIAGLASLVSQATAAGVRPIVATLTPFDGSILYSQVGESKRQAINAWIREHQQGAVADFDLAVRDPRQPSRISPLFDSGDHLHPNDDGQKVLASTAMAALLARSSSTR